MGKEKGYNSSHVYSQAKGWSKKSYENFLNDLEKVFKIVWRGRKWNHIKRVFEVEVFSSSQNIDFPFYLKRFLELLSLSLSYPGSKSTEPKPPYVCLGCLITHIATI
jgi:hypothetical protein